MDKSKITDFIRIITTDTLLSIYILMFWWINKYAKTLATNKQFRLYMLQVIINKLAW